MLTKYGTDNVIIMLGMSTIMILAAILLTRGWVSAVLLVAGILLAAFTFWFFRDPERIIPAEALNDPSSILAPSDGTILEIKEVDENIYLKTKAYQISIFLSPLDVHVNRIPINGMVEFFKYYPGEYIIANHPKSSEKNEQTHIGIANNIGKVFFKQIVGVVARRLVWDIKVGDTVSIGQKFGMMKFGSRIDIFFPYNCYIFVKVNDKLIGGETILAKFK